MRPLFEVAIDLSLRERALFLALLARADFDIAPELARLLAASDRPDDELIRAMVACSKSAK